MKKNKTDLSSIVQALNELSEDTSINKNIKNHIKNIICYLEQDQDIGKDKAMTEIEDMSENNNIEPYISAQICNVISLIEKL